MVILAIGIHQVLHAWMKCLLTLHPLMGISTIGTLHPVLHMCFIFSGASSFNSDVSNWNISNVWSTEGMFYNAASFNQNLCAWREHFRYNRAGNIFQHSNCNFKDRPQSYQKGPFCASSCIMPSPTHNPSLSYTVSSFLPKIVWFASLYLFSFSSTNLIIFLS